MAKVMLYKIKWALSAFFLSFFCASLKLPGYFAFPLFSKGLKRVSIGKYVRIYPHLRIETHGEGNITIEDCVSIAQNVHITSGSNVLISKDSVILANSFITSIDHDYKDINLQMSKQPYLCKDTIIGRNCFIGMGVSILAGTTLGEHTIVGANSVVRGVFPSYCVIAGAPARVIKKYCHETKEWLSVNKSMVDSD